MNIQKARLPKIYKRDGKECYLDPIRKRLICITPEETVRQKVISHLIDELKVPARVILVEESLSKYGVDTKNRADIIILADDGSGNPFPLAVIECKAEGIPLDEKAVKQMFGYSHALSSIYTLLINGSSYQCFKLDDGSKEYVRIKDLPDYQGMLAGKYTAVKNKEKQKRSPFRLLRNKLRFQRLIDPEGYHSEISGYTPMDLAFPVFNLLEGLMDERVKLPTGHYALFDLLEDYGVRNLTYGNAGGGQFNGRYRSFLVKVGENTEFFSIGMSTYWKVSWEENNRTDKHPLTSICVAHDDEKASHHSLQLLVDEDAVAEGKTVRFYHNGRIAIGRIGSGKKSELRELVEKRYPQIIVKDRYYLGKITADHLLRLDEPDVTNLIVNLISYAIVRDEFREIVKARKH